MSSPSRVNHPAIRHNGLVGGHGKRAGARPKRSLPPRAIALAGAGVAALVLWAYLVWAAIHFGSQARSGDHSDWWWAGLMTVGAVAALFGCLVLLTQSMRAQSTRPVGDTASGTTEAPAAGGHAKGGKRAAR